MMQELQELQEMQEMPMQSNALYSLSCNELQPHNSFYLKYLKPIVGFKNAIWN